MIAVSKLSVHTGRFRLDDLTFNVPTGGYTVLMGRTGCGKTTLLETLCGLRPVLRGSIQLMGRDVTYVKPAARGIAYVPQDRALFSTMSVRENLAFALHLRKWNPSAIEQRVNELANQLDLAPLISRNPGDLSGGEAQRVALGRALAAGPDVLLLDEPLSALDDQSRTQMHDLLNNVCRNSGVTALHVTHSLDDARQLADQVLVMDAAGISRQ